MEHPMLTPQQSATAPTNHLCLCLCVVRNKDRNLNHTSNV